MQMTQRHLVEGTTPRITIGHRLCRKNGKKHVYRTWTAQWSYEGNAYTEALKTTNKKIAIRRANLIHERIHAGQVAPRKYKISLVELWDQHLQRKESEGVAPGTIVCYDKTCRQFVEWARQEGLRSAVSFGEKEYYRYANFLQNRDCAESTVYNRLILLKQVFKWGTQEKLLPENKISRPKVRKPNYSRQACFTSAQVAQILALAEPHDACIYATLAYTGMRIGELRDLRWSEVDLERRVIEVRRGGSTGSTKNRKIRRIPINAKLMPYLNQLPRTNERVFIEPLDPKNKSNLIHSIRASTPPEYQGIKSLSGDGIIQGKLPGAGAGEEINRNRLLKRLKKLCKRCGFVDWERCRLHTFRHAFASACAQNNVPYRYALEWMGHHSSRVLDLYIKIFDSAATEMMQSLDFEDKKSEP